jgi:hypothetical protein
MSLLPFVPRAPRPEPSGPPRPPPQPRTDGADQPPPGFFQRTFGQQPQQQGPQGRPARGILVPGQQMPHVILNTVQVLPAATSLP